MKTDHAGEAASPNPVSLLRPARTQGGGPRRVLDSMRRAHADGNITTRKLAGLARLLLILLFAFPSAPAFAQRREPRKLFHIEDAHGRDGFIDRTGKVVIEPGGVVFDEALRGGVPFTPPDDEMDARYGRHRRILNIGEFSDGLARFTWDLRPGSRALFTSYGFIDETGKVVIPPLLHRVDDFHEGLAMFTERDGKRGYIDRTGNVVIPARYTLAYQFSEGLAIAAFEHNKFGYIDREGNVVIPFKFDGATRFSEGLAQVGLGDEKLAYIDRAGRIVFHVRGFDYGGEFREGLAAARVGDYFHGKWGFIDRAGKMVIPAEFDEVRPFSEGLALVRRDDSWGFIDRAGRVVIPFKYAYASSFSEGLAAVTVSRDRKVPGWGYIDRTGKVVIPTTLDYAAPFDGGLAAIDRLADEQDTTDAYIDPQGRLVWEKPLRY